MQFINAVGKFVHTVNQLIDSVRNLISLAVCVRNQFLIVRILNFLIIKVEILNHLLKIRSAHITEQKSIGNLFTGTTLIF